ncbi:BTB domain-containing protein [Mycena kentingensis (nom. inval.)]|nr:BTB domain-containing protein [Mycena kentingensis (nom. inval.)]
MSQRTASDATNATIAEQHATYWLADGSIVLEIQSLQFKIHRTLLVRHSPYLASILPTPPSESILSIQCASIDPAREVSARDFVVLLAHLYHDALLSPETPFPRLASVIRITSPNQLHFPRIHELALRYFVEMFPSGPAPFLHPPHLEEALALAQKYGVQSIQKGIIYSLVTTTDFQIDTDGGSEGLERRAPSSDTEKSPVTENIDPAVGDATEAFISSGSAHKHVLPPREAQRCMRLMTSFIEHFSPLLFTAPAAKHMDCTDVFAGTWMGLVIQPAIEDDGVYKPLETLERFKRVDWAKAGLCEACVLEKHAEWTEEQRVIWEAMDGWLA